MYFHSTEVQTLSIFYVIKNKVLRVLEYLEEMREQRDERETDESKKLKAYWNDQSIFPDYSLADSTNQYAQYIRPCVHKIGFVLEGLRTFFSVGRLHKHRVASTGLFCSCLPED